MNGSHLVLAALTLALILAGCGDGSDDGSDDGKSGGTDPAGLPYTGGGGGPAAVSGGGGELGRLTEKDVRTYIEVWPEYGRLFAEMVDSRSAAKGMTIPQKIVKYLESKGLTPEVWGNVVAKVKRTLVALGFQEQLESAQNEAMKKMAEQMLKGQLKDVSDEDIELVRKHKKAIDAMLKKAAGE